MDAKALLQRQTEDAYDRVRERVEGLSDAEYFWEPAPGCWRVFFDERSGRWDHDYAEPDPDPAPLTTIGWRLAHIATCKVMYHEWAFGRRELTWLTIPTPGSSRAAIEMLEEGHGHLVADLQTLAEADLDRPALTNWGEEWPMWRIFLTMIDHDVHHGAEIGALRDLYRATGGSGPAGPG